MQCNDIRNHFADYLKEQLPLPVHRKFAQHLAECSMCGKELEALTEVWAKLGTVPPAEPPVATMNARFHEALSDYRQTAKPASKNRIAWPGPAIAASVILALLVAAYFGLIQSEAQAATVESVEGSLYSSWRGLTDTLQSGAQIKFGRDVRSERGALLALADGSRVEMNSQSEVAMESARDGVRIRLNKGSVIVTAAEQRQGHLYVQTKDLTVSVGGTIFLVNAEAVGSRVAVIQGEVQVRQGSTEKILLPGDQVASARSMIARPVVEEIAWSRHAAEHLALLTQVQSAPAPEAAPRFEVAAIHPGPPGSTSSMFDVKNERVRIENMTLKEIIRYAYGVKDYQISGPEILNSDRYSINAKAPSGTPSEQFRPMMQSLLADRFRMTLSRETRELPVYALRVSDRGLKIRELAAGELLSGGGGQGGGGFGGGGNAGAGAGVGGVAGVAPGPASMSFAGTMSGLADALSRNTDRPVVDRTGLTGRYTVRLLYVRESSLREGASGPSLSSALEDLGLKLERASAPIEFLTVEHIEKPSEN